MSQRLTALITSKRSAWAVILLALILSGLAFAAGPAERDPSVTDSLPDGAESTTATALAEQLPQQDDSTAVILFTAASGTLTDGQLDELTTLATELTDSQAGQTAPDAQADQDGSAGDDRQDGPAGQDGQSGGPPPITVSDDGTAAVVVTPVEATTATDTSAAVTDLRERLAGDTPDGVDVGVTGPSAIQADLAAVFEGADFRLLGATATVVAILLVVTYRSPVLWIFPLLVIGTGDRVASIAATTVLKATGTAWDESTTGILSVLVFGAGTNYALLLISRYRDELRRTADRREALATSLTRTAHAVLASATTVVVGVLTLLLSAFPTTRGLGLACAVGIVVAVLYALVVLPAVLSYLGRWVFWPQVPREGQETLSDGRSLWRRIGDRVAARPAAFVAGALLVLAVGAAGISQVRLGLPDAEQFLDTPESIATGERLGESFPAGSTNPTSVLTRGDVADVQQRVEGTDGVASVRPSGSTEDGDLAGLSVTLADAPDTDAAEQTVRDLRAALDGTNSYVGGSTAEAIDAEAAYTDDQLTIMPLALGLVLVALVGLLRSLVAPVLLVATVVATFLASLGLSWWVFTGVFGFTALGGNAPLFAFLFLVALGVDYNIFLVTRAREEWPAHGTREGMLRALAATGGVITSAGILLAAVFAVLGVLPLVVLAQIGTIICIGVLLDTLLVRTVLVPALALLLGDRFWWPRDSRQPRHAA